MWTQNHKHCRNCNTQRRKHKSNGYCAKCYILITKLKSAEKWDFNIKSSIKSFPMDTTNLKPDKFERMKKVFIKQLENRLMWLSIRESKIINTEIDGIDLEYGFNHLATLCNLKNRSLFQGYANIFDHNFSTHQKKIIFEIIDEIEQSVPVKTFDFYEAITA